MQLDLIDVFGTRALAGNPLAVVRGSEALTDEQMLALTRWLNFSETTFLLPPTDPDADYRVRIFYPAGELPFAGHPTLGTCHVWLESGGAPREERRIVQQCGIGPVDIRRDGGELALKAPEFTRTGDLDLAERARAIELAGVEEAAVIEAVHIANGPAWRLLRLRSAEDVLAAKPAPEAPPGTEIGLAGPCADCADTNWELRAFFADQHGRLREDPVTGSFNAGVARHLFASDIVESDYIAAQGRVTGADGRVTCKRDTDGSVWIGGYCHTIARGASLQAFAA